MVSGDRVRDHELATEPAPIGATGVVAAVAAVGFGAVVQWHGMSRDIPSMWWVAVIALSTFVVANISRLGMGHGLSTDASATLGSASVMAFGPHPALVLAVVAGKFFSDLRVPHLTAGRTGAIYNASSTMASLVAMGIVVELLRGNVHIIAACLIGALCYSVVNVVTIAPAVIGWRGMLDMRKFGQLTQVIMLPVSEMFTELTTVTAAAVVVASFPWVAVILIHGPLVSVWSNIRRQSELALAHKRVTTDVLTGLPNRRGFEEWASDQVEVLDALSNRTCAAMILDLDNFKRVNDIHGHTVGDDVLVIAAQVIETICRDIGRDLYAARFGGEEFVVMGVGACVDVIDDIAERIREDIHERTDSWGCSASIGVAYPEHGDFSVEPMIRRADQAMYIAKMSGKNQVVIQGDARWKFNESLDQATSDLMELRTSSAYAHFAQLKREAHQHPEWQALAGVWASVVEVELVSGNYQRALDGCNELLRVVDQRYLSQRGRAAMAGAFAAIQLGQTSTAVELAAFIESISERSWPDVTAVIHMLHGGIIQAYGEMDELRQFLAVLPPDAVHSPWSNAMIARLALAAGEPGSSAAHEISAAGIHLLHQQYSNEVAAIREVNVGSSMASVEVIVDQWRSVGRAFDADQLSTCLTLFRNGMAASNEETRAA